MKVKIDCISDFHGYYPALEGGDLLIIAGDLTARDQEEEYDDFMGWVDIYETHYKKIVIIGGNHDTFLQSNPDFINSHGYDNIEYLCDSGTEFEILETSWPSGIGRAIKNHKLKIWGSPGSAWFSNVNPACTAFMQPDEHLWNKWNMIPQDTDILITHTPPYGTLDYSEQSDGTRYHMGSKSLEAWIKYVGRPLIHCFGHIHECGGMQVEEYPTHNEKMMKSINCSHVNEKYKPVNKRVRINL